MKVFDRRGAEITEGSYVIWFENRAGGSGTDLYTVNKIKTRVQITQEEDVYADHLRDRWVYPDSLIVVDSLPQVMGQYNTKKGTKAWQKKRLLK